MNTKEKHKSKMLEAFDKIKRCRQRHLKSLEIGNTKALKTFPEEIRQLKWLKKLSVTRTDISELPEWIGEFPELVILNLDSNKITSLPESIGNLKKLKEINLSCNRLQTLPETFGNLSVLESFELVEESEYHLIDKKSEQKAWFTHLPESFGNLSSLKHF
jgi:Leucine-rich repeat (LRR) protein